MTKHKVTEMKKGYWRSLWDEEAKSGKFIRLIGCLSGSTTIIELVGFFRSEGKSGNWYSVKDELFLPIGWMPVNETPVDEPCFVIGKSYMTKDGYKVKIVKENYPFGHPYACVQGDDGGWRYNRVGWSEMGRVTGTPGDMSHPDCLLLPSATPSVGFFKSILNWFF